MVTRTTKTPCFPCSGNHSLSQFQNSLLEILMVTRNAKTSRYPRSGNHCLLLRKNHNSCRKTRIGNSLQTTSYTLEIHSATSLSCHSHANFSFSFSLSFSLYVFAHFRITKFYTGFWLTKILTFCSLRFLHVVHIYSQHYTPRFSTVHTKVLEIAHKASRIPTFPPPKPMCRHTD